MSEQAHRLSSLPRQVGPGLLKAERMVQAAELAAAAGHARLSWAHLREWPDWARPEQLPFAWLRALGACWHALELQQCIDGARLNTLCEDLGAPTLQAVLQLDRSSSAGAGGPPPLPPTGSAADWREALAGDGRRVALATVVDPDLRAAVAAVLGWSDSVAPVSTVTALRWMALVQPART